MPRPGPKKTAPREAGLERCGERPKSACARTWRGRPGKRLRAKFLPVLERPGEVVCRRVAQGLIQPLAQARPARLLTAARRELVGAAQRPAQRIEHARRVAQQLPAAFERIEAFGGNAKRARSLQRLAAKLNSGPQLEMPVAQLSDGQVRRAVAVLGPWAAIRNPPAGACA